VINIIACITSDNVVYKLIAIILSIVDNIIIAIDLGFVLSLENSIFLI
jgi:hypothetical protein